MSPLRAFVAVVAISLIAGGMTAAVMAQETVATKFAPERMAEVTRLIGGGA
jgi:hypothetical protein